MAQKPAYIKENIEALNFKLSEDDMKQIRALDKERRFFTQTFDEIQYFTQWNPDNN